MKESPKLLDVVALLHDVPQKGLITGQVGTIVEILDTDVFEVEFVDDEGQTYAMLALKGDELMHLHYKPVVAGLKTLLTKGLTPTIRAKKRRHGGFSHVLGKRTGL